MKTAVWAAAGAAAVSLGVAIGSPGAGGAANASADTLRPSHFNHPQANPYFPLRPGLVLRYRGTDGGNKFRERVTITHKTKMIEDLGKIRLRRRDGRALRLSHTLLLCRGRLYRTPKSTQSHVSGAEWRMKQSDRHAKKHPQAAPAQVLGDSPRAHCRLCGPHGRCP